MQNESKRHALPVNRPTHTNHRDGAARYRAVIIWRDTRSFETAFRRGGTASHVATNCAVTVLRLISPTIFGGRCPRTPDCDIPSRSQTAVFRTLADARHGFVAPKTLSIVAPASVVRIVAAKSGETSAIVGIIPIALVIEPIELPHSIPVWAVIIGFRAISGPSKSHCRRDRERQRQQRSESQSHGCSRKPSVLRSNSVCASTSKQIERVFEHSILLKAPF
jgi:hypothetical protein